VCKPDAIARSRFIRGISYVCCREENCSNESTMREHGSHPDDSIGDLLRAHGAANAGGESHVADCEGFDPNLASSFVEGTIGRRALARYERQLASCAACRDELADFTHMWRVDATPTIQGDEAPGFVERVHAFFASLVGMPSQWALAVPALAVLLVGGFAWWVVANREAPGADVASAPREVAPAAVASSDAIAPHAEAGTETAAPPPSTPGADAGPSRVPAPVRQRDSVSGNDRVRPARPRAEPDESITRSVETRDRASTESKVRRVAGKTFVRVDGAWVDREYLVRDRAGSYEAIAVVRGTAEFSSAAAKFPSLAQFAALDGKVVVLEGTSVVTIVDSAKP
jgi:hypothetical protein